MSLAEVKEAISQLSLEERAELNRFLYGWEDDAWDKQMKDDVETGRLDDIISRAENDMKAGRYREIP